MQHWRQPEVAIAAVEEIDVQNDIRVGGEIVLDPVTDWCGRQLIDWNYFQSHVD